jgi:MarR family transcriptional regulator, transcriptional regulator for hemolysin
MNNHQLPPAKGVGMLIHDVARLLRRRIDQRAQAVGMTSAQWRVLSVVARAEFKNEEPPNQAALAEQMDLEPISLSRLIDRMEAAGLIERRADPDDRRAYRLYLQEAARPLVAKFRDVATHCMTDAMVGVSDAEIDMVSDVLSRVRNNLTGKSETVVPFAEPQPAAKQKIKSIKRGLAS